MNKYRYFFFKLYSWNVKAFGNKDLPFLNALLHLSLLVFINIVTLSVVVELVSGFAIIDFRSISVTVVAIMALGILIVNYFLLVHKNKLQQIINKYENESPDDRHRGDVVLSLYIGLTILSLVVAVVLKFPR